MQVEQSLEIAALKSRLALLEQQTGTTAVASGPPFLQALFRRTSTFRGVLAIAVIQNLGTIGLGSQTGVLVVLTFWTAGVALALLLGLKSKLGTSRRFIWGFVQAALTCTLFEMIQLVRGPAIRPDVAASLSLDGLVDICIFLAAFSLFLSATWVGNSIRFRQPGTWTSGSASNVAKLLVSSRQREESLSVYQRRVERTAARVSALAPVLILMCAAFVMSLFYVKTMRQVGIVQSNARAQASTDHPIGTNN